jgi:predicted peptidase
MIAKYPVDPARVYITGFSLGALYAWKTVTRHPDRFAAIAAVSGFSAAPKACAIKDMPAWAFHGTKDVNVPNKASRKMIEAIKKCGGTKAKLTIYEGVDHEGAWAKAYADPALYKWLLAQKRVTQK